MVTYDVKVLVIIISMVKSMHELPPDSFDDRNSSTHASNTDEKGTWAICHDESASLQTLVGPRSVSKASSIYSSREFLQKVTVTRTGFWTCLRVGEAAFKYEWQLLIHQLITSLWPFNDF